MRWIHLGLTVLLAVFMLFMGAQKFGAATPVFQYIAEQSGIGLFEPVLRIATGVAEVLAAALLLAGLFVGAIRSCGGMLSAGSIGGAIGFHLSPWLGISAPVAFDENGDYVHSPMLFGMAVVFFLIALAVTWLARQTAPGKASA